MLAPTSRMIGRACPEHEGRSGRPGRYAAPVVGPSGVLQIVQAADYGGPYAGSFVPMLRATAIEARARGHAMELVFSPVARGRAWLPELEDAGIGVHFAASRSFKGLAHAIGHAADREGPAVLHTHFSGFDLPALWVARRRRSTAVIWHFHTRLGSAPRVRLTNCVKFGVGGRLVDRILAVTEPVADAARARLAPASRMQISPNAVDLQRYPLRTPARIAAARQAIGEGDGPLVAHFGRDWMLKGGDLLLGAVRVLADRGSAVRVLTVAGPDAAEQAAALGLGDRVRVLPPAADASILYTAADVFVSSSRAEGMPYSLLEAGATGTGLVASAIPGQTELAQAIPGARLAPLAAEPLADAIAGLLDRSPEDTAADARDARNWVQANADLERAAERLVDLYEELGGHL